MKTVQEMKDRAKKITTRLDYSEPILTSEEIDELVQYDVAIDMVDKELAEAIVEFDEWIAGSICTNKDMIATECNGNDYVIDTVDKDIDMEIEEMNDRIESEIEDLQNEAINKLAKSEEFAEVIGDELMEMINEISKMSKEELDARQKELMELTNEDSIVGSDKRPMTNEEINERLLSKEEIDELLDADEEFIANNEAKIKENEGKEMAKELKEVNDYVWSIDKEEVESMTSAMDEYVESEIDKIVTENIEAENKYYIEMAKEVTDRIAIARVNYMDAEPTITISTEVAGKIVRLLDRID